MPRAGSCRSLCAFRGQRPARRGREQLELSADAAGPEDRTVLRLDYWKYASRS